VYACGANGRRATGLATDLAGSLTAVALPSGEVIAVRQPATITGPTCPDFGCGANGTQATGLAVDPAGRVSAVALPSSEWVALR
jgi:hypothetical protein